jgi:hypothetical protein
VDSVSEGKYGCSWRVKAVCKIYASPVRIAPHKALARLIAGGSRPIGDRTLLHLRSLMMLSPHFLKTFANSSLQSATPPGW